MTIDEYQELSRRTMDVRESDTGKRKMVATLGFVGEAGEVASLLLKGGTDIRAKLTDEVGDYLFYVAFLCHLYGWQMSEVLGFQTFEDFDGSCILGEHGMPNLRGGMFDVFECALSLAELVKKEVGHKHPAKEDVLKSRIALATQRITYLAGYYYGVELDECAAQNVEKLKRRYPDGFSPEASLNRKE